MAKGDRLVRYVRDTLVNYGYIVDIARKSVSFYKDSDGNLKYRTKKEDIFNLFDLVAVNDGKLIFGQVTTSNEKSSHLKKYESNQFSKVILPDSVFVYFFLYNKVKSKLFDVYQYKLVFEKIGEIKSGHTFYMVKKEVL